MFKKLKQGNLGDSIFGVIVFLFGLAMLALIVGVIIQLWIQSGDSREEFGLSFIWSNVYNPSTGEYGALPFIYGTLVTAFNVIVIAGPIGLGIAVF
ncbi:MAG: phosphate ABC transporter permease subunit PstC, partial [Rubrobacter sp.]